MTTARRICLVNPNMSESVTALLLNSARAVAASGTEVDAITAPRGMPYISNQVEALISGHVVLEMISDAAPADAFILAAFGDPGLFAARQLFDTPVIGMSEAAMLTACFLGKRFGIVTFAQPLAEWYLDCVEMHGMRQRLSGIHSSNTPFTDLAAVQEDAEEELVRLSNQAVENGADVIILGGAPLAGLAVRVAHRIPVPTIDPIAAAIKQAEAVVSLRPVKPEAGRFRRPDSKPTSGLHPGLAALLSHQETQGSTR